MTRVFGPAIAPRPVLVGALGSLADTKQEGEATLVDGSTIAQKNALVDQWARKVRNHPYDGYGPWHYRARMQHMESGRGASQHCQPD